MAGKSSGRANGSRKGAPLAAPVADSVAAMLAQRDRLNQSAAELGMKVRALEAQQDAGSAPRGLASARHRLRQMMDDRDYLDRQIAAADRRLATGGGIATPPDAGPNGPTPERLAKGDMYRGQHQIVDDLAPGVVRETVKGYRAAAAIDHYLDSRMITEDQWRAGDMLRNDYYLSETVHGVTARYAEPTGRGDDDGMFKVVAARASMEGALRAVGISLCSLIVHVVCLGQSAKSWSELNGRRGRSAETEGMALLRAGLTSLAVFYELIPPPEVAWPTATERPEAPTVAAEVPNTTPDVTSAPPPFVVFVPEAGKNGRKILSVTPTTA